jgi:nucleotide-binding universal stress UspA family protein
LTKIIHIAKLICSEGDGLMRILVAIDGSACSTRAVKYVAEMLRARPDAEVMVFHVLAPLPPKLREHGGSEDPMKEARLGAKLRKAQQAWYKLERKAEQGILQKAKRVLKHAGLHGAQVQVRLGNEDNIARNIIETARSDGYTTIVVGRRGRSGIKRFSSGGVTDRLIRTGSGFTIWIVE